MNDEPSVYGTDTSKPKEKAGVEVGGGEKAAAATDAKARKEAEPGSADDDRKQPGPEDPEEAQSPT